MTDLRQVRWFLRVLQFPPTQIWLKVALNTTTLNLSVYISYLSILKVPDAILETRRAQ